MILEDSKPAAVVKKSVRCKNSLDTGPHAFRYKTDYISSGMVRNKGLKVVSLTTSRFCVEMNNTRLKQPATVTLFQAVANHASGIPIVIIATKADQYRAIKVDERKNFHRNMNPSLSRSEATDLAENETDDLMLQRIEEIKADLSKIGGARFDGCVAVSSMRGT